jgi:hypothetical protein
MPARPVLPWTVAPSGTPEFVASPLTVSPQLLFLPSAGYVDLVEGTAPTITSLTNAVVRSARTAGPSKGVGVVTDGNALKFAYGGKKSSPLAVTLAGVYVKRFSHTGNNNYFSLACATNTVNTGVVMATNYGVGTQILCFSNATQIGSGVTPTSGVPYFTALSVELLGAGSRYVIVHKDLQAGTVSVQTGTVTGTSAGDGTWLAASSAFVTQGFPGDVHMVYGGDHFVPEVLLRKWAENPWQIFPAGQRQFRRQPVAAAGGANYFNVMSAGVSNMGGSGAGSKANLGAGVGYMG